MTQTPQTTPPAPGGKAPSTKAVDWERIELDYRALMWTSVGNVDGDARIEEACEIAGVIPLPYPSIRVLMASRKAARLVIARANASAEVENGRA